MKLWKPRQETLWALERSLDFTLIATEAHEMFNQECDMICFTSSKDYLFYSMEKGIAVMRIGKREVYWGAGSFLLELHYYEDPMFLQSSTCVLLLLLF